MFALVVDYLRNKVSYFFTKIDKQSISEIHICNVFVIPENFFPFCNFVFCKYSKRQPGVATKVYDDGGDWSCSLLL
jgi:hypothetical protein